MKTSLRIAKNGQGELGFRIQSGKFAIDVDVSELMQGQNSAPNPHTYFVASLLACKAITAKMYALRKGYPLADVHIEMEVDSQDEMQGVCRIHLGIKLIGALSEQQRQDIFRAMEHSPITRLMSDEVNIDIQSELT